MLYPLHLQLPVLCCAKCSTSTLLPLVRSSYRSSSITMLNVLYLTVDDDLSREGASIQVKIVIAQAVLQRDHEVWETA